MLSHRARWRRVTCPLEESIERSRLPIYELLNGSNLYVHPGPKSALNTVCPMGSVVATWTSNVHERATFDKAMTNTKHCFTMRRFTSMLYVQSTSLENAATTDCTKLQVTRTIFVQIYRIRIFLTSTLYLHKLNDNWSSCFRFIVSFHPCVVNR